MKIRIFTTGGTIDGVGCDCTGYCRVGRARPTTTNVPNLLEEALSQADVEITELFVKNSSKLVAGDFEMILDHCTASEENRVVITHGTHTMCKTAKFLGEHLDFFAHKTIVLTGAMKSTLRPGSDGPFNLGFALCAVECLPPGVYVAMHGRAFRWNNVRKDESTRPGRFTEIVA